MSGQVSNGRTACSTTAREIRPGWPEIVIALLTYLILIGLLAFWILQTPDEQAALRGIVGLAANGVAGVVAFLAAFVIRIRDLRTFGFRVTSRKWLLAGAALGVVAFGLSILIEGTYFLFITEPNTQGDFQAAAKAGTWSLVALLVAGALVTPFGEEIVFRGIVATALNRYGMWAGVVGSAAIFGIVHGPSVILLDAFMVGILAGALFRKTYSIWPTIVLHVVYNGIWLVQYSTI